jgi:gamma-glutamylcyclotransferase (GGCT)/AIG2-like uncharacterized protein YtfP
VSDLKTPGETARAANPTVKLFVNGQAMSGGPLHDALRTARFIGPANTAARYTFWSVRDEFPALHPEASGGWSVPGELYEITLAALRRDLLPREPVELELTVIELNDGSDAVCMRLRPELRSAPDLIAITDPVGWISYLETRKSKAAGEESSRTVP